MKNQKMVKNQKTHERCEKNRKNHVEGDEIVAEHNITQDKLLEMRGGFETAYIDGTAASNLAYKPQFISNNYRRGKKVLSSIEDELMVCEQFQISVAFITMGGITPLLLTLKELERKGIKGVLREL